MVTAKLIKTKKEMYVEYRGRVFFSEFDLLKNIFTQFEFVATSPGNFLVECGDDEHKFFERDRNFCEASKEYDIIVLVQKDAQKIIDWYNNIEVYERGFEIPSLQSEATNG